MLCKAHNCPFPGCHNGKASASEHCDAHASSSLAPSNGMYGFAVTLAPDIMYGEMGPHDAATASSNEPFDGFGPSKRFDGFGPSESEPAPTHGMKISAASASATTPTSSATTTRTTTATTLQSAYHTTSRFTSPTSTAAYGMNLGQPSTAACGMNLGQPLTAAHGMTHGQPSTAAYGMNLGQPLAGQPLTTSVGETQI